MTTIQSIPEEVLLVIFGNLSGRDLTECQSVCRSWYIPARVKFLNRKVFLGNTSRIKRFITAINKNPNPRFLAAVKEIQTCDSKSWDIADTVVHKLLFRFPNLEKVELNDALLNKFDDDLCREFLQHCPKLEDIHVYNLRISLMCSDLSKVRLLLTELEFYDNRIAIDDIGQFVAGFPRLKSLSTATQLVNFEKILPILADLPALTRIEFKEFVNDTDDFLERYLQAEAQDEKSQLLQRNKELVITCSTPLSKSTLGFITKYMTGLKDISVDSVVLNDPQQVQLYNAIYGMIQSIDHCRFMTRMQMYKLWTYLPRFIQLILDHPTKEKALKLSMGELSNPWICLDTTSKSTLLTIGVPDFQLQQQESLFDGILEMDTFELEFNFKDFKKTDIETYNAFFKTKSTLKEVKLYAPETILGGGKKIVGDIGQNHTLVDKLTIRSPANAKIEPLLDRCAIAFPNLKLLALDFYCGRWFNKYEFGLSNYKLEKLVLEMAPLNSKTEKIKFLLLQVEVVSLQEKYLYKFPYEPFEVTRINDQDLKGDILGEDYKILHVTVGSLQCLKLVAQPDKKQYAKKLELEIILPSKK